MVTIQKLCSNSGEARTNSSVMYSYGPLHMAKQKQDNQLEHTYSSYMRIRDVALKTCQKRWMIGRSGKRGSGISVLAAQHHDDDDDCHRSLWWYWCIFIGVNDSNYHSISILSGIQIIKTDELHKLSFICKLDSKCIYSIEHFKVYCSTKNLTVTYYFCWVIL